MLLLLKNTPSSLGSLESHTICTRSGNQILCVQRIPISTQVYVTCRKKLRPATLNLDLIKITQRTKISVLFFVFLFWRFIRWGFQKRCLRFPFLLTEIHIPQSKRYLILTLEKGRDANVCPNITGPSSHMLKACPTELLSYIPLVLTPDAI